MVYSINKLILFQGIHPKETYHPKEMSRKSCIDKEINQHYNAI